MLAVTGACLSLFAAGRVASVRSGGARCDIIHLWQRPVSLRDLNSHRQMKVVTFVNGPETQPLAELKQAIGGIADNERVPFERRRKSPSLGVGAPADVMFHLTSPAERQ